MTEDFKQSRNWCFTDYQKLDFKKIYDANRSLIRYIGVGQEICPTTKKKHAQGWIQFEAKKRLSRVKSIIGCDKIHVESCRGSELHNEKYCAKDNNFICYGAFITTGFRSDLLVIQDKLKAGDNIEDIMNNDFETYCRYRGGIKDYAQVCAKVNSQAFRKVKTTVLYGDTGTGKTRKAMEKCSYKITGDSLQWWDGYNGEKTILIDEYDSQIKCTEMLNILDGYQLRLPIKCGFTYAQWTEVYITSNIAPNEWHCNAKEQHRAALKRRISKILNMNTISSQLSNTYQDQ